MIKIKNKIIGMIAFSAILLSGCSLNNLNQKPQTQNINKQSSSAFQSSVQPFFASQNQMNQQKDGQEANLHIITEQLKTNYAKLFKVNYVPSKDEIDLIPTDKQVIKIIKYAKQENNSAITAWNNFVKGINTTSKSVSQNSHDKQVKMSIIEPNGSSKLYSVQNGKVLYNKFK